MIELKRSNLLYWYRAVKFLHQTQNKDEKALLMVATKRKQKKSLKGKQGRGGIVMCWWVYRWRTITIVYWTTSCHKLLFRSHSGSLVLSFFLSSLFGPPKTIGFWCEKLFSNNWQPSLWLAMVERIQVLSLKLTVNWKSYQYVSDLLPCN